VKHAYDIRPGDLFRFVPKSEGMYTLKRRRVELYSLPMDTWIVVTGTYMLISLTTRARDHNYARDITFTWLGEGQRLCWASPLDFDAAELAVERVGGK